MKSITIILCLLVFGTITSCVPQTYPNIDRIRQEIAVKKENNRIIAQSGADSVQKIPPLNKNYQSIVKQKISEYLKDSDSAKYRFPKQPQYCSFSNSAEFTMPEYKSYESPLIGYTGVVFVNAKNSFGGYTGEKTWFYMLSGNKITLLAYNQYNLWTSLEAVINHMDTSFSEVLLLIVK